MTYTKQTWTNGDAGTPLSGGRLNYIEDGIEATARGDLTEVAVTGATTLTSSAFGKIHYCTGTSADYALTLPAASGNGGKVILVRMGQIAALSKFVTVTGNASELIDGSNTRLMWAGETATLYCDGTGWQKIAGKTIPMRAAIENVASQTGITSGSVIQLTYDTTLVDNTARMADLANERLTCRRAGQYQPSGQVGLATFAANCPRLIIQLRVGGTALKQNEVSALAGASPVLAVPSTLITLAAAANVDTAIYQNSGNTQVTTTGAETKPTLALVEVPSW